MVKTMVCCHSFIAQQIYDLLRAACGILVFLPLDMFSNRLDIKPTLAPTCGSLSYTLKGGAYLGYRIRCVVFNMHHFI